MASGDPALQVLPADVRQLGQRALAAASALRAAAGPVLHEAEAIRWNDSSGAAFKSHSQHAAHGLNTIVKSLEDMACKLGATSAAYQATDDSFAGAVQLDIPTVFPK